MPLQQNFSMGSEDHGTFAGPQDAGRPIVSGNERVIAVNGQKVPEGASTWRWHNGAPAFFNAQGEQLKTGDGVQTVAASHNTNGRGLKATQASLAETAPAASANNTSPAASEMTEAQKIAEKLALGILETKNIEIVLGNLAGKEISKKESKQEELDKIGDGVEKQKRASQILVELKEEMVKEWSAIMRDLQLRAGRDGDKRLSRLADALAQILAAYEKKFDEYAKDPLAVNKENATPQLKCVICDMHQEGDVTKTALRAQGFTFEKDREANFNGEFASHDGKNYRTMFERATGAPKLGSGSTGPTVLADFATQRPIIDAIDKFYADHPVTEPNGKQLVERMRNYVANQTRQVAQNKPVPSEARGATKGIEASTNKPADVTSPAKKLLIQVGFCEHCKSASSQYAGALKTLENSVAKRFPDAKIEYFPVADPAKYNFYGKVVFWVNGEKAIHTTSLYNSNLANELAQAIR